MPERFYGIIPWWQKMAAELSYKGKGQTFKDVNANLPNKSIS
jgi:hypothetical protein